MMPVPAADAPAWLFALTAVVMIAGLALMLWLYLRLQRKPGGGDPSCGACGYSVRGLSTFICPECGADLRDVGINTERASSRSSVAPLLAWVAICAAGGLFFLVVLMQKGAPNGVIGQWLGISLFMTIGIALAGVWLIGRLLQPADATAGLATAAAAAKPSKEVGAQPGEARSRTLSIMFIDMAGFTTRAAGATRDGLVALVRRPREIVEPIVALRRGRIVKTMGDGMLITFDSATDAILAGAEVQRAMSQTNGAGEASSRIDLRVGISTGEVIVEAGDVYGDQVNLAARIQGVAKPGEVLFSEGTWHAMNRAEVAHEPAGKFALKGLDGETVLYRAI